MLTKLDPRLPRRRRILRKIKINEISAVDRPCQEGARIVIMKRVDPPEYLRAVVARAAELVRRVNQRPPAPIAKQPKEPIMNVDNLEQRAGEIRKRDGCSASEALSKARREHPQAFDAFRTIGTKTDEDDYAALVTKEMHGGCIPRHVAEQRVIQKFGPRPDANQIRKSESAATDFMATVDTVMLEKGLSRSAAMVEARRRYPGLFDRFQEV